ncbi:MAG: diguanylate cyclase [Desulfuromonadales bacterium]|nr:diguanylate cyclase [Desulfuromonadales bacterium]
MNPDNSTCTIQQQPPRQRLLLVDDQHSNIQELYEIFRQEYEVFIATSGMQALELCLTNPPDLIMLDIIMPGMDGLKVCRRLKAELRTKDIPIIFVTAQDNPEDETRGLDAGAVDFISKPFNHAVVRARVQTHLTLKTQTDLLRSMAFIDGLTGVANRRRFDDCLQTEWRYCRRHGFPLALFMVDIDHFKRYNDSYGHQDGDVCLRNVAALLKAQLGRPHDLVARYGGEEFACLLPGIDTEGALHKAQEMLQAIRRRCIPHASSETAPFVTISLGMAVIVPDHEQHPDQLVALADARLYQAKLQGRNRICADGTPDQDGSEQE